MGLRVAVKRWRLPGIQLKGMAIPGLAEEGGRGEREAAETRARFLSLRLASEDWGRGGASLSRLGGGCRVPSTEQLDCGRVRLRNQSYQRSPRLQVKFGKTGRWRFVQEKSKSHSCQWPGGEGGGQGTGKREGKSTTVPARRGGAAAAGTGGFTSSLGLRWGVALRAAIAAAAVGGNPPSPVECR